MRRFVFIVPLLAFAGDSSAADAWREHVGKPGPGGWRCHIIQPDPMNHGPDGINFHDWDGDGDLDLFVNYEEGHYSRLYFHPGKDAVRGLWDDSIEFKHGPCEDSGIGDLDDDGDIDYIANGGWVYFNPGREEIRSTAKWEKMTLFDREQRVPVVADIDGDGLNDLIAGGRSWFKQPATGKHDAKNWIEHRVGDARWPMNCIPRDVDRDGDLDLLVADRRNGIFWFDHPGKDQLASVWPRRKLHPHKSMFIAVGDLNGDETEDLAIAGGAEGTDPWRRKLTVLLRTNQPGAPSFTEIRIAQPCGNFPKGVGFLELDGNPKTREIVVVPKQGDLWMASYEDDPMNESNWKATPLPTPGADTRLKMDNAFIADIDGDGDDDIATTEENGGWGVIWFENPLKSPK